MIKQPLTQDGINALTRHLYALSDLQLEREVLNINTDFLYWMEEKFNLSDNEYEYIANASVFTKKRWGGLFGIVLGNRGPILMGALPPNPAPRRIKELHANLFGSSSYNNQDMVDATVTGVEITFVLR